MFADIIRLCVALSGVNFINCVENSESKEVTREFEKVAKLKSTGIEKSSKFTRSRIGCAVFCEDPCKSFRFSSGLCALNPETTECEGTNHCGRLKTQGCQSPKSIKEIPKFAKVCEENVDYELHAASHGTCLAYKTTDNISHYVLPKPVNGQRPECSPVRLICLENNNFYVQNELSEYLTDFYISMVIFKDEEDKKTLFQAWSDNSEWGWSGFLSSTGTECAWAEGWKDWGVYGKIKVISVGLGQCGPDAIIFKIFKL